MTALVADHRSVPDESPSSSTVRSRLLTWRLAACVAYPVYLLLLGPYHALNGTGVIDFLPRGVRDTPYYPAMPVYSVHGLRGTYDDYLRLWYQDPNEADPPTGWY